MDKHSQRPLKLTEDIHTVPTPKGLKLVIQKTRKEVITHQVDGQLGLKQIDWDSPEMEWKPLSTKSTESRLLSQAIQNIGKRSTLVQLTKTRKLDVILTKARNLDVIHEHFKPHRRVKRKTTNHPWTGRKNLPHRPWTTLDMELTNLTGDFRRPQSSGPITVSLKFNEFLTGIRDNSLPQKPFRTHIDQWTIDIHEPANLGKRGYAIRYESKVTITEGDSVLQGELMSNPTQQSLGLRLSARDISRTDVDIAALSHHFTLIDGTVKQADQWYEMIEHDIHNATATHLHTDARAILGQPQQHVELAETMEGDILAMPSGITIYPLHLNRSRLHEELEKAGINSTLCDQAPEVERSWISRESDQFRPSPDSERRRQKRAERLMNKASRGEELSMSAEELIAMENRKNNVPPPVQVRLCRLVRTRRFSISTRRLYSTYNLVSSYCQINPAGVLHSEKRRRISGGGISKTAGKNGRELANAISNIRVTGHIDMDPQMRQRLGLENVNITDRSWTDANGKLQYNYAGAPRRVIEEDW